MHFRRLFTFLVTAFLAATFLHAQVAGRLSGIVVDQTGAAVPGAVVNVFLTGGKEPLLKGQTNESGQFSFVTVRPDTYDVSVESQGFTRVVVREVRVAPVQETSLPAIKLELQSTTTTVEVASDVQAVQLSNAEVSATITSTQVQNLPLLGRQVSTLFQTQAGVISGSNTTNDNGLRPSYSNVTLDGMNIPDSFSRRN